jgi:hypothetical protein
MFMNPRVQSNLLCLLLRGILSGPFRGGEEITLLVSTVVWLPVAEGIIAAVSVVETASSFSNSDIVTRIQRYSKVQVLKDPNYGRSIKIASRSMAHNQDLAN